MISKLLIYYLLHFSLARRKYNKHLTKARRDPTKYLSLIIDGMDQSKTEIPHTVYRSTLTSSLWKLRTHLVVVIAHGRGIFGFFDHYQYSALDKLLGQLGIYATWLSSIAYLQKQLRIFIFFTPRFFLL